jgi:hypothetical protein
MEAFMEGYHVMRTHPQIYEVLPSYFNTQYGVKAPITVVNPNLSLRENIKAQVDYMDVLSVGMGGMWHQKEVEIARTLIDVPLPEGDMESAVMAWYDIMNGEITKQLRARGEATPDINAVEASHPVKAVEYLFPNYFLLRGISAMSSYRIRPLGPESCLFELWSLTLFPEGKEPPVPLEPTMLPYDSPEFPPIPQQDYANIPEQQIGLHAKGFEFMRLSKDIEGLISNYQRIIDGYLRGLPLDKLKDASAAIGSNFDGPVLELGL